MSILPRTCLVAVLASITAWAQGVHLAHTLEGRGPAVVFLHGLGGRRGVWKDVAAALRRDHAVLCLDLPGHGQSGPPPLAEDGTVDLAAVGRAVADLVREQKLGPALLVGHSLGGPVAAEAALAEPDLFRGLVLVDSFLAPLPAGWVERTAESLLRDKPAGLRAFLTPMALGSRQGERVVQEALAVEAGTLAAYLRAAAALTTATRIPELALPVLAIQADPRGRDEKAEREAKGLRDVPRLKVVRLPRSRHWPMWDEREAFLRALADFEAGAARP